MFRLDRGQGWPILRRWGIVLLCLVFSFVPAYAQAEIRLSQLSIQIWPEFDRPEALIIYQGHLTLAVSLPATLKFRLPSDVEAMNAVAVMAEDGNLVNHPYELDTAENTALLTLTVEQPFFQFEYYDPSVIVRDGAERQLNFAMVAEYAVDSLQIDVQQPRGAQAMQLSPAPTEVKLGADQLTYHTISQPGQPAGATISVTGSYQKTLDTLTAASVVNTQPAVEVPSTTVEPAQPPVWIGYVLVGVGAVILLFSGGMWFFNQRRLPSVEAGRYRQAGKKGRAKAQAKPPTGGADASNFCHKCGTAYKTQAAFCHHCGAKRR